MANEQNLIKNEDLTPSQRRENASKAGKASAKAKRQRKAMKEQMEMLLSLPIKSIKLKKQLETLGIKSGEIDNQMALIVSLYQTALKGGKNSVQAFSLIQETVESKKENDFSNINQNIQNIAYLINNPQRVRTEDDINE